MLFFFSSRRRHTRLQGDWSSDVCSSDLPHPEEKAIVEAAPETALYVAALKQKNRKVVALALRQLLRLLREYPRESFLAAVQEAARYGLYDLDRLERMILRRVARDYFLLLDPDTDSHD